MLEEVLAGLGRKRREALARWAEREGFAEEVEAALPDLVREGDEELLEAVVAALPGTGAARRRVLEALTLRGGGVRAAALRALQ